MRKLVMWNLLSLDGCFEGSKPWDLDFHTTAWGEELSRFSLGQTEEIGVLLFGHDTYEGMATHWSRASGPIADFINAVPKVVFATRPVVAEWNNTRVVTGDACDEVAALKAQEGRDLFVFGSAQLSDALLRRGLFDELRICLAPVVLGTGTPLFKPGAPRRDLELLEAHTLDTGGLVLRYAMKAAG